MLEEYYLRYYIHEDSGKSYGVIKVLCETIPQSRFGVSQCDRHLDKHCFPLKGTFIVVSKWIERSWVRKCFKR